MKLTRSNVQFKLNENLIEFSVIHNLPNIPGLSFKDAVQSWLARTTTFTAKNLCRYIMLKNIYVVAMTEKQYKRLST